MKSNEVDKEIDNLAREYILMTGDKPAISWNQPTYDKLQQILLKRELDRIRRVPFSEYMKWAVEFKSQKSTLRFGQAFCNHFYDKIGRGDHTHKLFYANDKEATLIIEESFIDYSESTH